MGSVGRQDGQRLLIAAAGCGPTFARRPCDQPAFPRQKEIMVPRYLVERTFANGLGFPIDGNGRKASGEIVAHNSEFGVTWVHSYVSGDDHSTWCIYDAPSPEAIRSAADRNELPVDRIHEVRVLDPYFYGGG